MQILKNHSKNLVIRYLRWAFLSIICGLLAGVSSAIFLFALQWVTLTRQSYPLIIWALPLAGLFIGWIYYQYGKDVESGNNLIIDQIHDPKKITPFYMAPLVFVGTIITHLFGGSAGREGTAVQMAASLSDQLTHLFKIEDKERKILLMAGMGAGFSSAVGAPFAGVIFGMEVITVGRISFLAWFECLIASFIAYYTTIFLQAPHSLYPAVEIPNFNFQNIFYVLIAGFIFGIAARLFVFTTHAFERTLNQWIVHPIAKPFIGGLIIILLFYIEGSYRYSGLGIEHIQAALKHPASFKDPVFKSISTSLTVGSGFKGGEFIPLVFIGSTLGSALSVVLPIACGVLGALGFSAVFGAAANTPITCMVMAIEIFGIQIAPFALVACFAAYFVSGRRGIYKTQRILN